MHEETAALIEMLQSTRRPQMREALARQLVERADPDAAPTLIGLLDDTNDPRAIPLVTVALAGLQQLGPTIAPLLLAALDGPPDTRRPFMPLLLAAALGEAAVPRLLEALHDAQQDVRINAATQLGVLRARRAFEPLLVILQDEGEDRTVRGVAASALGALRDPRAMPILTRLSETDDPQLLAGAIDGLAEARDPEGIPYLEAILARPRLDERTERAVRLALLAMERYRER
ncbi:MAG TPA: HEAT repeat domain-containing protein [Chloroflexota bacterium]|nr:HEAT repeat domain-containing protein [Chloroflexota bacterium]